MGFHHLPPELYDPEDLAKGSGDPRELRVTGVSKKATPLSRRDGKIQLDDMILQMYRFARLLHPKNWSSELSSAGVNLFRKPPGRAMT